MMMVLFTLASHIDLAHCRQAIISSFYGPYQTKTHPQMSYNRIITGDQLRLYYVFIAHGI